MGWTRRIRLTPVLCAAVLAFGAARACYYEALDLENPADYYYRYCYAGVSAHIQHSHVCPSRHSLIPVPRNQARPTKLYSLLYTATSWYFCSSHLRSDVQIARSCRNDMPIWGGTHHGLSAGLQLRSSPDTYHIERDERTTDPVESGDCLGNKYLNHTVPQCARTELHILSKLLCGRTACSCSRT